MHDLHNGGVDLLIRHRTLIKNFTTDGAASASPTIVPFSFTVNTLNCVLGVGIKNTAEMLFYVLTTCKVRLYAQDVVYLIKVWFLLSPN